MLTEAELLRRTAYGEDGWTQFALDDSLEDGAVAREVCAFANSEGGYLVFGIDDDDRVVGCSLSAERRDQLAVALDSIEPRPHYSLYPLTVQGLEVWVLDVPEGVQKPYLVGGCLYERRGARSVKVVSPYEMRHVYDRLAQLNWTGQPLAGVAWRGNIDGRLLRTFRSLAGISAKLPIEQVLLNLGVTTADGTLLRCGELFFGKSPQTFFGQAQVHCALFRGHSKVNMVNDALFGGPLPKQLEAAEAWLKATLPVAYNRDGAAQRGEEWAVPLPALREAVLNALVHRDYGEEGNITVEVYDDRVVVTNPGGLLEAVAKNFGHLSKSRNERLLDLCLRMKLAEKMGSGIGRMRERMRLAGLPAPIFNDGHIFSVTFMRGDECLGNEAQRHRDADAQEAKDVLDKARMFRHETPAGLARWLRIPEERVQRQLAHLQELGLLTRLGRGDQAEWLVL